MRFIWKRKLFKTLDAMNKWLAANEGKIQYEQIFVNNAYGVLWRNLHRVY